MTLRYYSKGHRLPPPAHINQAQWGQLFASAPMAPVPPTCVWCVESPAPFTANLSINFERSLKWFLNQCAKQVWSTVFSSQSSYVSNQTHFTTVVSSLSRLERILIPKADRCY